MEEFGDIMSFSLDTKLAIIGKEENKSCCILAEIAAYIFASGTVVMHGGGKYSIKISFDMPALARRTFSLIRNQYGIRPKLSVIRHNRFGGGYKYILTLPSGSFLALATQLKLVDYEGRLKSLIPQYVPHKTCCKRAFIKASFLCIGSVQNPQKGYHLEMVSKSEYYIKLLRRLCNGFGIETRHTKRRDSEVLYIKKADTISDFLALVDADSSVMKLENTLVRKQVINSINRAMNCDNSNINKTIGAASRQINDIRIAIASEQMNAELLELANLRLANPDLSLEQIGSLCDPPLSKSGVVYRFKKIHNIAEKYR